MNDAVMNFVAANLSQTEVAGARVLEVGSYDVNGSVRPQVQGLGPQSYLGVDLRMGPGVDRELRSEDLVSALGEQSFDIVISTETLEHMAEWRAGLAGMMEVLVDGGLLVLTSVGPGFPYHGYPEDHWRFREDDLRQILMAAGFEVLKSTTNPAEFGVMIKGRRPRGWQLPAEAWKDIALERPIVPNPLIVHIFPRGVYIGVTRFETNDTVAAYLNPSEATELVTALNRWLGSLPTDSRPDPPVKPIAA
jgi:hypothetical protein